MILGVCKKVIAAFVIFGWVSLSCFDVVEDLAEIPGQVAISSSPDASSTFKGGGWGPLANNVVESANQTERADHAVITVIPTAFNFEPVFDFRRQFQLHKLYRVFLI